MLNILQLRVGIRIIMLIFLPELCSNIQSDLFANSEWIVPTRASFFSYNIIYVPTMYTRMIL